MKSIIIAKNKEHLLHLIQEEIRLNGDKCDLNHIDVSNLTDLSFVFHSSDFNGDISQWNVSKVHNMQHLFSYSKFNGDISKWDVGNVVEMYYAFVKSEFINDLNTWKPLKLLRTDNCFASAKLNDLPYWSKFTSQELKNGAIQKYLDTIELKNKLNHELPINKNSNKNKI